MLEKTSALRAFDSPLRLADLVRTLPTLCATDSLGKALVEFDLSGSPVLAVVAGDRLLGTLAEADLLAWAAAEAGQLDWMAPGAMQEAMVMAVMRPAAATARADDRLEDALPHFEVSRLAALPVLDASGRYAGMLTRQRVLQTLGHALRPERIGGMATPLGVYLTTGSVSAGVGFWGLFLTGVVLSSMNVAVALGVAWAERLAGVSLPTYAEALIALGLFLVLLRLSPLAGYHAAEHQTVNAIERGEPLVPDVVAAMPREHPRCGTNLMALLFGAQLLLPWVARDPLWLLPAMAGLYLGWKRVGGFLQRFFTTRPARPNQLASGLLAGQALLAAYARRPGYKANKLERIWQMGLVQIAAGSLAAIAVLEVAARFIPSLRGLML